MGTKNGIQRLRSTDGTRRLYITTAEIARGTVVLTLKAFSGSVKLSCAKSSRAANQKGWWCAKAMGISPFVGVLNSELKLTWQIAHTC